MGRPLHIPDQEGHGQPSGMAVPQVPLPLHVWQPPLLAQTEPAAFGVQVPAPLHSRQPLVPQSVPLGVGAQLLAPSHWRQPAQPAGCEPAGRPAQVPAPLQPPWPSQPAPAQQAAQVPIDSKAAFNSK